MKVFIETLDETSWKVTTTDKFISLMDFETREDAVNFCRAQNLQIMAIVRYK